MKKKILIIGAGVAGIDVANEIRKFSSTSLKVAGFLDDDLQKQDQIISGHKVLGTSENFKQIIKGHNINEAIIAIPSAEGEQIAKYVKQCVENKISFRIVPRVKEIIEGKAKLATVRKVQVEDLLGRPVVKSDVKELRTFFNNKSVMITGAAGSIGSELMRQVAAYKPKKIIALDWWENGLFNLEMEMKQSFGKVNIEYVISNIRDRNKMYYLFSSHTPNYIFHAAAYKHVPLMEDNPDEAIKNNVLGTLTIARLAKKFGVERFVIVSTDKAANPRNIMGASKLITESVGKYLNSSKTRFMSVRFGNVLGSYGSVVPIFRRQIEDGGPLTITDKRMTRFFMTIPEAAQLILKAGSMGTGGELFVLDMGKPIKITDLAENMIRLSGKVPGEDIKIVFTGKRKGEKLHERLFNGKEKLESTKDQKIYITKSMGIDMKRFSDSIRSLKAYSESQNIVMLKKQVHKLIPSYKIKKNEN